MLNGREVATHRALTLNIQHSTLNIQHSPSFTALSRLLSQIVEEMGEADKPVEMLFDERTAPERHRKAAAR
jgi:hypothetical protein